MQDNYAVTKSGRIITDRYGNLYSTQYGGSTCRCLICGTKRANSNQNRQSYLRVGICRSEDGRFYGGAYSKRSSRKIRRARENRTWKRAME